MKIKNLHKWHVTPKEAVEIQYKLQRRICADFFKKKIRLIAGADASFSRTKGLIHGAVATFNFPDLKLVEKKKCFTSFKLSLYPWPFKF